MYHIATRRNLVSIADVVSATTGRLPLGFSTPGSWISEIVHGGDSGCIVLLDHSSPTDAGLSGSYLWGSRHVTEPSERGVSASRNDCESPLDGSGVLKK